MFDQFELSIYEDYKKTLKNYLHKPNYNDFQDLMAFEEIISDLAIKKPNKDFIDKHQLLYKARKLLLFHQQESLFKKNVNLDKDYMLFLSKKYNYIDFEEDNLKLKLKKVDINQNLELISDFMSHYNSDLYDIFKDLKTNNHIKIFDYNDNINYKGVSYLFHHSSPYIILLKKNNIMDGDCLIHEVGHCYQWNKSWVKNKNLDYFYSEVYSHYVQFLYLKFLADQGLYKKDVLAIKKNVLQLFRMHLVRLNNYYNGKIKFSDDTVFDDLQYAFGQAIALYYYNKYLIDPERADYDMEKFVIRSTSYDSNKVLDELNINKRKLLTKKKIENFLK